MKKGILLAAVMFCSVVTAFSAITIRYQNQDAKSHQMPVRVDGLSKTVTFDALKTSSVTISATATTCIIQTYCGPLEVKDGSTVTIKNGCITVTTVKPR